MNCDIYVSIIKYSFKLATVVLINNMVVTDIDVFTLKSLNCFYWGHKAVDSCVIVNEVYFIYITCIIQ